jgi:hypothetical protein
VPELHRLDRLRQVQMSERMVILLSAILAVIIAGSFSINIGRAESLDDDCLSKPDSDPPTGSHWYYYVDRGTHGLCWFLAPERETLRKPQAASAIPLPAPRPRSLGTLETMVKTSPIPTLVEAAPEKSSLSASIPVEWLDLLMTRGSGSGEQTLSSYARETAEDVPQADLQSNRASVVTTESPEPDPLPARAVLIVFAGALLVASLVARLVSWQFKRSGV